MEKNKIRNKVYYLSCGRWLDKSSFLRYFEKKVLYTIKKFDLISKEKKIAVAFSGGKDSMTLLYLLNKLYSPKGNEIIALAIDEGIPNYRDKLLENGKKFCKKLNILLKIFSFKKEFGFNLTDKKIQNKIKKLKLSNCYVCSILKKWLLNKKAKELKCDVIATAHSLDDEAENIILNLLKGSPELLAKLGPATGIAKAKSKKGEKGFVQRIKPFYLCRTKEILLYAKLNKLPVPKSKAICPLRGITLRVKIRKWLEHLEKNHAEIKNSVVQFFLKIMFELKKKYKQLKFKSCKRCGFPSSDDYCKACLILEKLK